MRSARVLISAGEASGDLYASRLVERLRRDNPDLDFFGCAGPRMRAEGVEAVIRSESLAVAGLIEVIAHIPRIYGEYRRLLRTARERRPQLAILTDSPDFHLRVAKQLKKLGIPVVYLIAPQVWAWRRGRLPLMRRTIDRLLCIFPFEEPFFAAHGVAAEYIGHPLTRMVHPSAPVLELRRSLGVEEDTKLIALLPGSRPGEIARHWPVLVRALDLIRKRNPAQNIRGVVALAPGTGANFKERFSLPSIQVREGQTWDVLACSDLALAASGTVTIEACLLHTPMVTFYRVNRLSWFLGKFLVRTPFFSMVNLVAGRRVVPELIQGGMTAERLAAEACALLNDGDARRRMREDLEEVERLLSHPPGVADGDPMEAAASAVNEFLDKELVHVS